MEQFLQQGRNWRIQLLLGSVTKRADSFMIPIDNRVRAKSHSDELNVNLVSPVQQTNDMAASSIKRQRKTRIRQRKSKHQKKKLGRNKRSKDKKVKKSKRKSKSSSVSKKTKKGRSFKDIFTF
ncbi:MAG: hypothetical protein AB2693_33430 [Candidatus Thiodiazotropha sp.]